MPVGFKHCSDAIGQLGVPFPRNFRDIVKTIVRRLFRIYAHLYSSHFDQICALGIERTLDPGTPLWRVSNRSVQRT